MFDESHHMDNTNAKDYSKISHTQHYTIKTDPFKKKSGLPENPTAHAFFKCQKHVIFWLQCYFSNPTIWKPTAPAF